MTVEAFSIPFFLFCRSLRSDTAIRFARQFLPTWRRQQLFQPFILFIAIGWGRYWARSVGIVIQRQWAMATFVLFVIDLIGGVQCQHWWWYIRLWSDFREWPKPFLFTGRRCGRRSWRFRSIFPFYTQCIRIVINVIDRLLWQCVRWHRLWWLNFYSVKWKFRKHNTIKQTQWNQTMCGTLK